MDIRNRGIGMFREFGIPARIRKCKTIEELQELKSKHNSKNNCYISVYTFTEELKGGKTNYDSAIINTIWFDFDHDKDVSKCLKDVRKLYQRYCRPRSLMPHFYYTGGRGFQINIDFPEPLLLPDYVKKTAIRDYLLHLKKKYTLTTLDEQCINNSVSALRRMSDTSYIDKKTKTPNGRTCIELSLYDIMNHTMEEIIELSHDPSNHSPQSEIGYQNDMASIDLLHYVCQNMDIDYTPTNSIEYLLNEINKREGLISKTQIDLANYLKPPRKCVVNLIDKNMNRKHSGHTENNVIATELICAGWKDEDISYLFQSIYNEPAGDYGWYNDDGSAGYQIMNLRAKGINRFSKNRLLQLNICKNEYCGCGVN
jgi:hypothetical protein|tara:strand:- start:884 stop:1990 length:1107 start_codon:yes stop_codon:yes gene_type:complete